MAESLLTTFDAHFQRNLLAATMRKSEFLRQAFSRGLQASHFSDEWVQVLLRIVETFHATWGEAPDTLIFREITKLQAQGMLDAAKAKIVSTLADDLFAIPLQNNDYLLSELDDFLRHRKFTTCLPDVVAKVNGRQFAEAEKLLQEVFAGRGSDEFKIDLLTGPELVKAQFPVEFIIDKTFIKDQPLIVAGPEKALKTGILQDAAISICTGTTFLGKFQANGKRRVLFMSGESGDATIKNTFERICGHKELSLNDIPELAYTSSIPQVENPQHLRALAQAIKRSGAEVCIIDPFYFALNGEDAGNLFVQGRKLQDVNEVCKSENCTLVICHHFNNGDQKNPYRKPTFRDIAWAGFKQFARQWWLIGRCKEFDESTGVHNLHFVAGGSAGHSMYCELEIREGLLSDAGGRGWLPFVLSAGATADVERRKDLFEMKKRIVKALDEFANGIETRNAVREKLGTRSDLFDEAFEQLIAEHAIKSEPFKKHTRTEEGWRRATSAN